MPFFQGRHQVVAVRSRNAFIHANNKQVPGVRAAATEITVAAGTAYRQYAGSVQQFLALLASFSLPMHQRQLRR